jgi:hypothetical protein
MTNLIGVDDHAMVGLHPLQGALDVNGINTTAAILLGPVL